MTAPTNRKFCCKRSHKVPARAAQSRSEALDFGLAREIQHRDSGHAELQMDGLTQKSASSQTAKLPLVMLLTSMGRQEIGNQAVKN